MNDISNICKAIWLTIGGAVGWLVDEFEPTFPLIVVMILFVVYDAVTAFQLDKRVRATHPTQVKERKSKFSSYLFGKVVRETIPKRLVLILLAFLCEKYVCVHVNIPLSYIVTGVICFEQAWSILENESSCRDEKEGRFYKVLQRIMIDKTERHFDIELDELKDLKHKKDESTEKGQQG